MFRSLRQIEKDRRQAWRDQVLMESQFTGRWDCPVV